MTKGSDNVFPKLIESMNTSDPAAPSDSSWKIYAKAPGIYARSSNGIVGPFGAGGSGSITASGYTQTTARLLGRTTASTGAIEEITVGTGLSLSAGSLTATGGSGGALVFLEAHSASASATLDFTTFISSTYDSYLFKLVGIMPATTTALLYMRMGTGGGPTWDAGASYGSQLMGHNSGVAHFAGGDSGLNQISLTRAWLSAGNHPIAGEATLSDPQNTSLFKWVHSQLVYPDNALSNMVEASVSGQYNSTTAVTGVRFLMSSGNITSGTIRVYGYTKS